MVKEKISNKDILKMFTEALLKGDLTLIEPLLKEDGDFDIQNEELETVEVGKYEYLSWLKSKLTKTTVTSLYFDQCLHCKIGNSVLIVNHGEFPRKIKDNSERSKTGLMIDSENGEIKMIQFCYVFVKTENKWFFELQRPNGNDFEIMCKTRE